MDLLRGRNILLQSIQGLPLGILWQVLERNRFRVSPRLLGRLLVLIGLGGYNSLLKGCEVRNNDHHFMGQRPALAPLFIIGHWRSGTTLLHNLLALDPNHHGPTYYQCMFPWHCAYSERKGSRVFDWLSPGRRPMDTVPLMAQLPHEDEFALAALSGVSPYLRFLFPAGRPDPWSEMDPDRLPAPALDRWITAYKYFTAKLNWSKGGRRLVLKSPPHTARIRLLLALSPGARFVLIHRNPYDVFGSTRKLWRQGVSASHLTTVTPEGVDEIIMSWYTELLRLLVRDRPLIPAGQLVEVRYDDLAARPVETLAGIYQGLGLPGFEDLLGRVEPYLSQLGQHRVGTYEMTPEDRKLVADRWQEGFGYYGYQV